jgi:adenylate cyclase
MGMKYRKKLSLSFLAVAVFSSALGLTIVYFDSKQHFRNTLRERIVAVSATTAALLDANDIKQIIAQGSENTPLFKDIVHELRQARDANRDEDWYVLSLYIMTFSPSDPKQMIFVADAEENPALQVHLGQNDEQQSISRVYENTLRPYAPENFITDPWGTWMSGFAPIFDDEGHYVATVGADVSIHIIQERLSVILIYGLWGMLGSISLALIGAQLFARWTTRSLAIIHRSVKEVANGNLDTIIELHSDDEFEDLSVAINDMIKGLREREKMKASFARYVSQHVLESITQTDAKTISEGERRKITIMFSDIRGFTKLSEKLAPESVVSLLNEYFENMIDIIFKYQGTLDKFLGDGMMIEFGAPLEDSLQEYHAVLAALEMQKKLKELCEKWKKEDRPVIRMGIGIHTGYAVVGNIGSEKRMEYTAIGDTVNVASRLEKTTKTVLSDILISQTTYDAIKDTFNCTPIGPVTLRGRDEEIEAYSVSIDQNIEHKEPK